MLTCLAAEAQVRPMLAVCEAPSQQLSGQLQHQIPPRCRPRPLARDRPSVCMGCFEWHQHKLEPKRPKPSNNRRSSDIKCVTLICAHCRSRVTNQTIQLAAHGKEILSLGRITLMQTCGCYMMQRLPSKSFRSTSVAASKVSPRLSQVRCMLATGGVVKLLSRSASD